MDGEHRGEPDAAVGHVEQADWDPRGLAGYVFLVLGPVRVQAWRESNQIPGRTLMRDGLAGGVGRVARPNAAGIV